MESIIPLGTISGAEPEYIEIEADPRTVTGAGVRAISQFLTGFVPALRGVKAAWCYRCCGSSNGRCYC